MIETALSVALGIALFFGALVFVVALLTGAFDFKENRIRREQARRAENEAWKRRFE